MHRISVVNLPFGDIDIVYCLVTCPDCQFRVQMLVLCMIHVHLHMCYLLPNLFTACAWFNWF